MKHAHAEEKTTAEEGEARKKDQPHIPMGENSDADKDEREDETHQDVHSPEDKLFLTIYKKAD